MAKFIYKGTGNESTAFGVLFPKGKEIEVVEENAVKKLTGNPCFENVEEGEKALPVAKLIPLIKEMTIDQLVAIEEGEERATVVAAIAKRRAELAA
jgi:hypothetical protein